MYTNNLACQVIRVFAFYHLWSSCYNTLPSLFGVIAVPDQSYDIDQWWKSSKGFRTVFSEIIAFSYPRCRYNYEKIFQEN